MRENAGETLKPNSPLIREEFDIDKPEVAKYLSNSKEAGLQTFLSRMAICSGVKRIVKKRERHRERIAMNGKTYMATVCCLVQQRLTPESISPLRS